MDEERNELASLSRESNPPPGLADAIAAKMRREGLLRRRRAPLYAAAAAMLIVIAGVFFWTRPQPQPAVQANYILLLYESPQFRGGSRAEYAQWAREMRPLIVGGEELASGAVLVDGGAPAEGLAGFFLIDARDDAAARRVALQCPHRKHGGTIVLRRIVL